MKSKRKTRTKALSWLLSLALVLGLFPSMSLTAYATEELLTTITATGKEQASYSVANVATVSFSYTAGGSSAYLANWGWWGYGFIATVTPAEGYTITKCVFYDDANRTATDSEAPFVVETTEEDKTPRINGTPIDGGNFQSKGLKKIEVYGYATPAHTHDFTYSASGATITATCGEGCDITEDLTLTISAPTGDLTADGTKTFPATLSTGYNTTAFPGTYAITYTKDGAEFTGTPTEAGEYTASVTVGTATASVSYTVYASKDTQTITASDVTATYGDTNKSVSATTDGNGTISYAVKSGSADYIDVDASTGALTIKKVGTATVIVTAAETATYSQATKEVTVTINKANPTYTVPTGLTATYGDTLADVTLPTGWSWNDAVTTSVGNAGTNTFKATFTPTDTANYNTVENVDVTMTVSKATPAYTVPTGLTATYGQTLADVTLPTGWSWNDAVTTSVGNAGSNSFNATFTPEDTANYNTATESLSITVSKATPSYTVPTGLTATYGDLLSSVALPTGWAWTNGAQSVGNAGSNTFTATFTPTDTDNYNTVENVNVTVTVNKADPTYTVPTDLTATYGNTLSSVTLPTGWSWVNSTTSVGNVGSHTFKANFTPTDTANYNTVSNVDVTVTVNKANPTYTVPTDLTATYGNTLSSVTLPTGWSWVNSTTSVGNVGSHTFKANFTPTDTANYNTVSNIDVTVTVNKANPTYTVPTDLTATYGNTLSSVTLPTGWSWADSTQNVGNAGSHTFKANFTPTDTDNYNTVENVDVTLPVNPASVTLTANSGSATYDATEKTVEGFTASVEGLTFTGVTAGVSGTNAGEYAVTFTGVTANETKDSTGNYVVTETTDGKLTIGKAPLAVTADNLSKRTGNDDPTLTYKAEGFLGTDTAETVITGTLVRDEGEDVGTYPIKQGTLAANNNYEITFTEGTFTINRRSSGGGGTTTYTVKFDTTGGSEVKNVSVKSGQTIGSIKDPQKNGFVFTGWYSDNELTKPYSADEKVNASTTLYAGWKVDPVRQITLTIGKKEATVWNEAKSNDVAPIIRNDRTMLPARFVSENLGATVEWIGEEQKVLITKDDLKIEIYIGSEKAYVNGEEVILDSPAFIENDRTYTPVRFIAETLGVTVDWDEAAQQVIITKPVE